MADNNLELSESVTLSGRSDGDMSPEQAYTTSIKVHYPSTRTANEVRRNLEALTLDNIFNLSAEMKELQAAMSVRNKESGDAIFAEQDRRNLQRKTQALERSLSGNEGIEDTLQRKIRQISTEKTSYEQKHDELRVSCMKLQAKNVELESKLERIVLEKGDLTSQLAYARLKYDKEERSRKELETRLAKEQQKVNWFCSHSLKSESRSSCSSPASGADCSHS